jgi:hypothetical protein
MRYELLDSLGTIDANYCNAKLGASIDKRQSLAAGSVVELPDTAAAYLTKKYPTLLKPLEKVQSQAKREKPSE